MKFNIKQLHLMANSARRIALTAIQGANSGHPGAALGTADIITTLYANHLRFDPRNPNWPERDRFVLSMGHASSLLYAVLHLTGYDLSLDDIKKFRKIGSKTPGHPETFTPGVEVDTGPLGQGFASAVGMAIAARKTGDARVYVLCSDGDLMEGVVQEAISFAGFQRLNNLIVFWDDNGITIDGAAQSSEDQVKRFAAAGWDTISVNGHDAGEIDGAIDWAKKCGRPVLIACKTRIGCGSSLEGRAEVHGTPFAAEEATALLEKLAAESDDELWKSGKWKVESGDKGSAKPTIYSTTTPALRATPSPAKGTFEFASTRDLSGKVVNEIMKKYGDKIIGATADLADNVRVLTPSNKNITAENFGGNFINFGVREHLMSAAMNGIALSGFKTFCSTFFAFADYMRPAIRLAAMMNLPQIFVFSHDSIGVGEDGPTHQPIEQLASLRAMPNLCVWRPSSAAEVRVGWELALNSQTRPFALALSRQKFMLAEDGKDEDIKRGGYVVWKNRTTPSASQTPPHPWGGIKRHITIIATGAEIAVAISAAKILAEQNINAVVVSMPSVEIFREQTQKYRDAVLQSGESFVVSVEAGATFGWREFADFAIGVDRFGASGSADAVMSEFGFTGEKIAKVILVELKK
jgi:transketolase